MACYAVIMINSLPTIQRFGIFISGMASLIVANDQSKTSVDRIEVVDTRSA